MGIFLPLLHEILSTIMLLFTAYGQNDKSSSFNGIQDRNKLNVIMLLIKLFLLNSLK
jgi:hypothetical protein